jgi:hypothetical protein
MRIRNIEDVSATRIDVFDSLIKKLPYIQIQPKCIRRTTAIAKANSDKMEFLKLIIVL